MLHHEGIVVLNRNERPRGIIEAICKSKVYRRNENVIIAFVGKTGSGKSLSALAFARRFPGFDVKNIVFTSRDFFRRVNSGELKRGSVILFDEAEVSIDNMSYWDKISKFFGYLMATVRYRNYIIIFTMPFNDDVLKKVRRLIHYIAECTNIKNREHRYTYIKFYENAVDHRSGDFYQKFIRVWQGGKVCKLKYLKVFLPPKNLIDYYEGLKHPYVTKLYHQMENEIIDSQDRMDVLSDKQKLVYYLYTKYGRIDTKKAVELYGAEFSMVITEKQIQTMLRGIRKKNFTFEPKPPEYMSKLRQEAEGIKDKLIKEALDVQDITGG